MKKNRAMKKNVLLQRGFTLIEVFIVLVMIGVLLTVAIPSFTSFIENQKVKSDAQSVAKALSFARAQAIVRQSQSVTIKWNNSLVSETITDTEENVDQDLLPGYMAVMDTATNEFLQVVNYKKSGAFKGFNDNNSEIGFNALGAMTGFTSTAVGINNFEILFCSPVLGERFSQRVEVSQSGRVSQKLKPNASAAALKC